MGAIVGHEFGRKGSLTQTVIAPRVERSLVIQRENMVAARRHFDNFGFADVIRHIRQINYLCHLAFAPDIEIAFFIGAHGIIPSDRNIRNAVFLEFVGNIHHIVARRDKHQRTVLFAQIQLDKVRSNKNEECNDDKHAQCHDRHGIGKEVADHHAHRTLHLFLRVDIHFLIREEQTLDPAEQEKFLGLLGGAIVGGFVLIFTHVR